MTIPFGYKKETDEYVDIDEVENGLACNCICPSCGMRLEARHGNEREHHFKHHEKAETECSYSFWVAVRSMAKQILERSVSLNVDTMPFFTRIPFKNQWVTLDVFAKNPRQKNHGFDFELLTPIGYIYIYFVTLEDASAGRYRSHFKNKPKYFTSQLILEIDLTSLISVKNNTKSRLEKLILEELDSKEWVTPKYPFKPKPIKKDPIVSAPRVQNTIATKNIIVEEDLPNYKKRYVIHKELLTAFGLQESNLSRENIRTLNTMIGFYEWQNSRENKDKQRTKYFSIVYSGMNLYFISYENEFYGVAKLNQLYVYQIVDNLPVLITKAQSLLEIDSKIDLYICERENIF